MQQTASPTFPSTLADWLDYQQRVHPRGIELGLERVREVWQRLGAPSPAPIVFTVAGTNGKGSTVAFLDAMLRAMGHRVGTYTSPHLLRYNERVHVAGVEATDDELIEAFARIDAVRGEIALTYFEFGTLAALLVFARSSIDIAVLEVGLGGRLDAVNIIDADVAIVTTIDLDHQDWLGDDLERIAREKAGIFRAGRHAIIGDKAAPSALVATAIEVGARLVVAGRDYRSEEHGARWRWIAGDESLELPELPLTAPCQHMNAAAALAAIHALRGRLDWNVPAIVRGLSATHLSARMQRFAGPPELVVDVAHNPQAARILSEWLRAHPAGGRDIAVFAALGDKDIDGIVTPLLPDFAYWHLAGLDRDSPRGLDARALRARIGALLPDSSVAMHADVAAAVRAARALAQPGDRIIAFGSFFVAAAILDLAATAAPDEI